MSRSRGLETLLFWVMAVVGAAALAPCLILPPWLEYQAQLERRQAAEEHVAALERRLRATARQIDHLEHDPAYILRLAEEEFGDSIEIPESETIRVEPSPDDDDPVVAAPDKTGRDAAGEVLPDLSEFLDDVMQRYPLAHVFVNRRTRPVLMGLGGILLLTAIVLLGRAGVADAKR